MILLLAGGGQLSIGLLFWLLMILWLIFGLVWGYPADPANRWRHGGGHILLWVVLFLIGWEVFGWPIGK